MRRDKGFSLLEVLVSLFISTLLYLAFMGLLDHCQQRSRDLALLMERDSHLWLSPLLLSRWILPAGNHAWQGQWSDLHLAGEELEVRSDMDGPGGFPDAQLQDSFEDIRIRCSGSSLQVKSGKGNFQPVLNSIHHLEFEFRSRLLLRLTLESGTRSALGSGQLPREELQLLLFLRNRRANLFREDSP